MKRIVCFIAVVLLLFLCLTGCRSKKPYSCYVNDYTFDRVDRDVGELIDQRNEWPAYKKENMKDQSVTVDGITYTGTYKRSERQYLLGPADVDCYETEDGCRLSYRSDTGEMVLWKRTSGTDFDGEYLLDDAEEPAETAERIADDFAKRTLTQFDQYEKEPLEPNVLTKEINGASSEITLYYFTYTKRIEGFLTKDRLTVTVSSKGKLCAISKGYIGDFDRANLRIDKERLDACVLEKAHAVYENSENFTPREYTITSQKIILTFEGYYAMRSDVAVTGTFRESEQNIDENYTTVLCVYTILK